MNLQSPGGQDTDKESEDVIRAVCVPTRRTAGAKTSQNGPQSKATGHNAPHHLILAHLLNL